MKEFLMAAIKKQLEDELEILYNKEVALMTERFEQRKNEVITGTVLNITRDIQIDQMRDQLTIKITNLNN